MGTAYDVPEAPEKPPRPVWVRPVVVVVVVVVCGWIASNFLGAIDWEAVGDALRRLHVWQLGVLIVLLLVRQTFNALPLTIFIDGLGIVRAVRNDATAALMSVVTPPPADMVMRLAMFKSWGIDPSRGLAGATMNTLAFYVNRFAAPVAGVLILLSFGSDRYRLWAVLACAAIAVTIGVLVYLVVRAEGFAHRLGHAAGRLVGRFRSSIDPVTWAAAAVEFRGHVADKYRRGFPVSLAGLLVMVLADACILLAALRFVGVTPAQVPAYELIGVFFVAYPLTLPPFMGLGVYDVVLLGALMELGGDVIEPEVIAALTVWRAVTILGPILMGVLTTLHWRWQEARRVPAG